MAACQRCKSKALVTDDVTGDTVCSSCGIVQDFDNYQHTFGGVAGPEGTFVRLGTTGSGTNYSYKERKLYESNQIIEEIAFRLSFSDVRTRDVKSMVEKVTDAEFGLGCELYEMGRMLNRVVDFLGIELKEFDLVGFLERSIRGFSGFSGIDREKVDLMVKQGNLVIQCAIKWFLTTGRRPGPVVVAVLVFVGEVNEIKVRIEDAAKEMNVAVRTCKVRYKELLEAMVEVAKRLPWGDDVNVKNVVNNGPSVLKYIEMKSMEDRQFQKKKFVDKDSGFDLEGAVRECLSKEGEYEAIDGGDSAIENGLSCFDGEQNLEYLKVSHVKLAKVYSKFKAEFSNRRRMNYNVSVEYGDRLSGLDARLFDEWWGGRSELCEKLLMEQLLEKDVGLDALPPSYIRGCLAVERRREKIRAAKKRINSIINPPNGISSNDIVHGGLDAQSYSNDDTCTAENLNRSKKRKKQHDSIDWEDFIIETLLLHRVKEEEIEKGYYNALLGLYVFRSGLV